MQPQHATRGIAAVALSSAGIGVLLLALALLLSGCGASFAGAPAAVTSSAASVTGPAAGAVAPTSTPSTTTTTGAPTVTPPRATSAAPTAATEIPSNQVVPSVPVTTAPAVPLTAAAPAAGGGSITIGTVTGIQGTAQLPGEIAGPAVQVPVTLVAGTGGAIDLNRVVVDLVDSAGVSAGQLTASPAAPFAGTLAPGARAGATYVFSLATDDRRGVRIIVSYTTAAPVVVFAGNLA